MGRIEGFVILSHDVHVCICRPVEKLDDLYIQHITCGNNFAVAISCFGDAYSWGVNSLGQLMQDTQSSYGDIAPCKCFPGYNFKQVRCGTRMYHGGT